MISLEKDGLKLRALEPEDLSLLLRWENNPHFWTASHQRAPYSEYLLKNYLQEAGQTPFESGQLRLVITVNEKSIGLVDCFDFDPDHQRAGIGILIGESQAQGQGYAQKSLRLFLEYLFPNLNLHQVYAGIAANNQASLQLFEKCGFKKYGHRKQWYRQGDSFIDEYLFQLLKADL